MPVLDVKITALEALKPLTTHSKSNLSKHLRAFDEPQPQFSLQMKAENQNFPQITRIWLENIFDRE